MAATRAWMMSFEKQARNRLFNFSSNSSFFTLTPEFLCWSYFRSQIKISIGGGVLRQESHQLPVPTTKPTALFTVTDLLLLSFGCFPFDLRFPVPYKPPLLADVGLSSFARVRGAGEAGSGEAGAGEAGAGEAGAGEAGAGEAGSGEAGAGNAGAADACSGEADDE